MNSGGTLTGPRYVRDVSQTADGFPIPDHTLLHVIGRGSYGEVWLARNVMGTLRAVKIVRRAAFDSDRPYLREFEGIRRCEPVSRAHDGLIDILHIGRHEEMGWFYYVMELADGTDPAGPGAYAPATLSVRLAEGKPLGIPDCLRLAESLGGALAFLHEQGLIHRDVKPSNIMYAGGVPKLGDIGLVAEAGSSRSYVGTEGFVPLEGPGTERADIFALGKVLYEVLTGLDRGKFPQLPQGWSQAYDFDQRLELNEIVLRACEGDPVRRYHTAREMLADIALVASGRSVKKLRGMERRLKVLRWSGLAAAAVAVVALGITWLVKGQADRERSLRLRANQAELAALYDQVHAARHDPSVGAAARALRTAAEAARVHVTPQLIDDAAFLLSRSEFVLRDDLKIAWSTPSPLVAVDADSGLAAQTQPVEADSGGPVTILLHVAGAPERRRTLTVPEPPPSLCALEFSHGGQRLLLAGRYGSAVVLDTADGKVTATLPPDPPFASVLRFVGQKGDTLIHRASNGGLAVFTLPGLERTFPVTSGGESLSTPGAWPLRDQRPEFNQSRSLWPSPDGSRVLLIDEDYRPATAPKFLTSLLPGMLAPAPAWGMACLVETATGRILWKVAGPDEQTAAWSADGSRIAVRSGERILSLDAATGETVGTVPERIINRGTQLIFLDSRDILVFSTWSMTGYCDLGRGIMLGRPAVFERWSYSPGRSLLLGASGAAEWRPSPVLRILQPPAVVDRSVHFSFPPAEDWIIAGHPSAFECWRTDRKNSAPDAILPASGAAQVLFSSGDSAANFLTKDGRHETAWTGEPPAALPGVLPYGPGPAWHSSYACTSRDGKVLAFGGNGRVMVHSRDAAPRSFPNADTSNPVGLSPDGRWLAVGGFHQPHVRLYDLQSPGIEPVHAIPCGSSCYPAFSPDGQWFACSGSTMNQVFQVNGADPVRWAPVFSRERSSLELLGQISFSGDGKLMAVNDTTTRIALIEPGSWRLRFHLESPLDEIVERNALSPTGRYFAAVGTRREIYLWDLQALTGGLKALGLDDLSDRTGHD